MDEKYIKALEGISYTDWSVLENAVNGVFQKKMKETANKICLSHEDNLPHIIDLQSGRT